MRRGRLVSREDRGKIGKGDESSGDNESKIHRRPCCNGFACVSSHELY